MAAIDDLNTNVAAVQASLATLTTDVGAAITAFEAASNSTAVEAAATTLAAVKTSLDALSAQVVAATPGAPPPPAA